ncbi:MAG: hypothetical protein ACTSUF_02090, partial [Candidatus Heimdallarchaeaceae archaeon]
GTFNITWTASKDPNSDPFNYSLYLYHSNGTLAGVLADNNITEGTEYYTFDSTNYPDGQYYLMANATDNESNTNFYIMPYYFTLENYDNDFKVFDGSGWSYDFTNNPIFICGKTNPPAPGEACTDSYVSPEYQSSSQAIFNLTNNGTASGTGKLRLTGLFTNITIFCDNDNDYSGATTLSTSYQDICGNIDSGSSCLIWCWANFTTFIPPAESYNFEAVVE